MYHSFKNLNRESLIIILTVKHPTVWRKLCPLRESSHYTDALSRRTVPINQKHYLFHIYIKRSSLEVEHGAGFPIFFGVPARKIG